VYKRNRVTRFVSYQSINAFKLTVT